jgi:flagellum-specific ATP synthase
MPAVVSDQHRDAAAIVRRILATYARSEDLIRIGAYKPGADPLLDLAIACRPQLRSFLIQSAKEHVSFPETVQQLSLLAARVAA